MMDLELPMRVWQAALLFAVGFVTLKLPTIYKYIRVWTAIRRLPTPPGATLFMGHAAAYSPLAKHRYEETSAKSLGPVYRYRNYTNQIVVVNDPALQQEIFAAEREGAIEKPDQPNGFSKGKGRGEMNVFSEKSGDPMWKLVRKGTAPAFAAQNLRNYHHHIVDIVDRLIGGVKSKGPHTAVNIADIAQRESFDVIGKVGFGRDFQASKDIDNPVNTFQQLTDDLEESVHRLIHPWRKYSLSKEKLARDKNHESIRSIYKELVDECLNRPPSEEDANSIAGHLLRLRDANGRPLSRERLIEEFSIFFVAGSETTGHTVAWTLWFLAQNPAALHKLEKELDAAGLLKTAQNPNPRAFTYADISKLHWLDCCIKEAMRLQPVAANSLRRLAVRDVALSNGVVIPAGVIVELAQYSVFRNPAWGWEDPNAFKPERWEDPEEEYCIARHASAAPTNGGKGSDSEELEIDAAPSSAGGSKAKRMHPFGAGIRNCLGQQLAKINVPTAVAMLTREFHLTLAPQTAGKDLAELEVLKATLQPRNGIYMLCKPRA